MPTSSAIPIVQGTLCWLRSSIPENVGIIVEAVSYYGLWQGQRVWVCKSKSFVTVRNTETSLQFKMEPGSEFHSFEHGLVPIAGPGLEGHVTAYDMAWKEEKRNQYAALYGAAAPSVRSTPNVRR